MARVMEMKKKMTKGRQKIQMNLIEDKEDRAITFSKRKSGIFKKASEISMMCGAKVLFILFSPVGKAYSFAHPTVKSVADKFLGRDESGGTQIRQIHEAGLNNRLENLVMHHRVVKGELETVSEQVSALSAANKFGNKGWWEANLNEMNSEQEVEEVLKSVLDFELALSNHFENLKLQNAIQASNINPVVPSYDQFGDVNNFFAQMNNNNAQMGTWNGASLPSAVEFGQVDIPLQGSVAPSAIGYGGGNFGQGDEFNMPAAGYGGSGLSLPAVGYEGTFGIGNDNPGLSGVGYEFASGGTNATVLSDNPGLYGVGYEFASGGTNATVLSEFSSAGVAYDGDIDGNLYESGFGGTFGDGLPDPAIGFHGNYPKMG